MCRCKMYVLMTARYFTPQLGLKGWSEGGDRSGVDHTSKRREQGPCHRIPFIITHSRRDLLNEKWDTDWI